MRDATQVTGEGFVLRPVERRDAGRLESILREPGVAAWWGGGDPDPRRSVEALLADADAVVLAIDVDGEVVGLIQYHEEDDPDYRHASIDMFLATASQGRGLGRRVLTRLARHLFDDRGHHRLTIDPAAANERAIRTYERAGFRRVGVMRRYEQGPDGEWRDGLLLELLADELRD